MTLRGAQNLHFLIISPVPAPSKLSLPWGKVRAGLVTSESIGVRLKLFNNQFIGVQGFSRFLGHQWQQTCYFSSEQYRIS